MSIVDFINALGVLKLKLSITESHLVFDYLDRNKDGYLNYTEFCSLSDEKRKSMDNMRIVSMKSSNKDLNNLTMVDDYEQFERLSNASHMYKGLKSNKLKSIKLPKHIADSNYTFGVTSLPSDNINTIISHGFASDYV